MTEIEKKNPFSSHFSLCLYLFIEKREKRKKDRRQWQYNYTICEASSPTGRDAGFHPRGAHIRKIVLNQIYHCSVPKIEDSWTRQCHTRLCALVTMSKDTGSRPWSTPAEGKFHKC